MEHLIGQSLGGRYRIDSLLGEGGMGAVLKGYDVTLKREVAIKVMSSRDAQKADFRERFRQEAQAAAKMKHPSIVGVHDFGQEQGILYIVMEFIPGDNLREMLIALHQKRQWIDLLEAIQLVRQVSLALAYLHRQGILHRDIKPANIMLTPEDDNEGLPYRPVITDLGLAKLISGELMTQAGSSMGTPPYMSPEQALGEATDARSDVYSLGILLYELTAGRLPFPAKTITEAIRYHTKEPPPPPRTYQPDLPEALERVILKALEKAPEARYPSGEALAEALAETLSVTPAQTAPPTAQEGAVSLMTRYQESLVPSRGGSLWAEFPSQPANLTGDRIVVLAQGKDTQTVAMNTAGVTIGRKLGNDLVLDDPKVSGQHAKVVFDGTNYKVTDLDSTNGTSLASRKLMPGVPEIWTADKVLRIGKNYLRLERGKAAAKSTYVQAGGTQLDRSLIHSSAGEAIVGIVLEPLELSVEPGQNTTASLMIFNQSPDSPDHFQTTVDGVPPEWVTLSQPQVELMPGHDEVVTLTFHPPRVPHSQAQTYPLIIRVTSQKEPDQVAEVTAVLSVTAYQHFDSRLQPARIRAGQTAQVIVENQGNTPQTFNLSWQDQAHELTFDPLQGRLTVAPGQTEVARFQATPRRRPFIGGAKIHDINVEVNAAGAELGQHTGQVTSRGVFPVWLPPLLLFLCVGAAAIAGAVFFWQQTQAGNATATAQAQTTQTAEAIAAITATAAKEIQEAAVTETYVAQLMDTDGDGLTDIEEEDLGTDPNLVDTDGDGLTDKEEVDSGETDPNNEDSDDDGLSDGDEKKWGSNPNVVDSDGDTLSDGQEVAQRTSPINPDTDGDGQPDNVDPDPGEPPTQTPTATSTPTNTATPTPNTTGTAEVIAQLTAESQSATAAAVQAANQAMAQQTAVAQQATAEAEAVIAGTATAEAALTATAIAQAQAEAEAEAIINPPINVSADQTTLAAGQCTNLRWNIENVQEIRLDGNPVVGQGSVQVCPTITTTYTWRILKREGAGETLESVTIMVPTPTTVPPTLTPTVAPPLGYSINDFVGNWVNVDSSTRGMTRLIIQKVNNNTISYHGFGSCSPTDCDWDMINVPFTPPILVGTYDFGFKTTQITVQLSGSQLLIQTFDDYTAADGRTDRTSNYEFKRE